MFEKDDVVMYGHSGVCKITDICKREFNGKEQLYYVMKPLYENGGTVYVPVENKQIRLRNLISDDDVHALIKQMPSTEMKWIDNDKERQTAFGNIIKGGNQRELIGLISILYTKQLERKSQGKKIRSSDERVMADAERLLYQEFAAALHILPEEVPAIISSELGN